MKEAESPTKKARDERVDILRGLAVFFVLWGHSIQYFIAGSGTDFFEDRAFRFIYSFHMPLFALISGYLFSASGKKYSFPELLKNKARSLALPALVWGVILFLYQFFTEGSTDPLTDLFTQTTELWFVWAVFVPTFLTGLVESAAGKLSPGVRNAIHTGVWLVLFLLPFPVPILTDYRVLYVYPFFLAGFFYRRASERAKDLIRKAGYLSLPLFPLLLPSFHKSVYIYTTKLNLLTSRWGWAVQLRIDLLRWLIAFAGCTFFCTLLRILMKSGRFRTTAVRLLSGAGQISLQVYLVQRLLLERIAADCWISCTDRISNPLTQSMPVYDFLITPLIALSFYCVIFLLIRLIRPYRVPKLIFFGGR